MKPSDPPAEQAGHTTQHLSMAEFAGFRNAAEQTDGIEKAVLRRDGDGMRLEDVGHVAVVALLQEAVVGGVHDAVALAGPGGEAWAVQDVDAAAGVADHSSALEGAGGDGYGGALESQHPGEGLLGTVG